MMSQSMHLLLLFVLLLHIHSISSASLLSMKKLTPEELPVHTSGANMTNLATLLGTSLAGYYTEVYYSDAACSAVQYADQYQLQVCTPWVTGSFKNTFNGTHLLWDTYYDALCSRYASSTLYYVPIQVCGKNRLTVSVTTSASTITTSKPLLSTE